MKIGITGQSGFIGTHLFNFLKLQDSIITVPFEDVFFDSQSKLESWVAECDVIVHLAGVNRHSSEDYIFKTNIELVEKLILALNASVTSPHILFSSSTQEEKDNPYGKAKKAGRELLLKWSQKNEVCFTGMVLPNVFGPFGNPYYNSVVATFCHQLSHNETPEIHVDAELKLIYIQELIVEIFNIIKNRINEEYYEIAYTSSNKVSEILSLLQYYKKRYFDNYVFPKLNTTFETNLFNTFRCYFDQQNFFPLKLKQNTDDRGSFVETLKSELGGQFSFSTTKPGISRGNHFHIRKIERFIVIKGEAIIRLRRIGTSDVLEFKLNGNEPAFVDMPVWYTHNITNTGNDDLYTLFWINEFYNPDDPDTYYEDV